MIINYRPKVLDKIKDENAVTIETGRRVLNLPLPSYQREDPVRALLLIYMGIYIALLSAVITLTVCKKISFIASSLIVVIGFSFLESTYQLWGDKNE